jgi:hypothetical protein
VVAVGRADRRGMGSWEAWWLRLWFVRGVLGRRSRRDVRVEGWEIGFWIRGREISSTSIENSIGGSGI